MRIVEEQLSIAKKSTIRPSKQSNSRRILVSDATTEALAQVASENPHGLLLARDELAGFLGNLDRYGAQSGADEAFFLSAFDGDATTIDRKTIREPLFIPALTLSIIGTCQPAVFEKLMTDQHRASGLLARFLLIEPPTPPKRWRTTNLDPQILTDWSTTLTNLIDLPFLTQTTSGATAGFTQQCEVQDDSTTQKPSDSVTPWPITVTPEAEELYSNFYNVHNELAEKEHGDRRALLSKAEQLPLRLALILHHLEWAAPNDPPITTPITTRSVSEVPAPNRTPNHNPKRKRGPPPNPNQSPPHHNPKRKRGPASQIIPPETMQAAITLTHWFIHETPRVYTSYAAPEERLALELETWIATRGGKTPK